MSDLAATRPGRAPVSSADRHARGAVAALFLTNGAIFANVLPRYPGIKADLDLSNAAYGFAVAAFPTGALVAGLAAGVLIRHFRSSRIAVLGTLLTSAGVLFAGLAPSGAMFAVALFLAGSMDAITDVAQNAHGLRVQRRYGRSILNSFHAVWSIGAVLGGLMAAGAIALDLPRGVHLGISAVLFSVVSLSAYRFLLPGPEVEPAAEDTVAAPATTGRSRAVTLKYLVVLALVLVAIGGAVVEDAGNSWASVYLADSLGAAASVAAFGFIALVGAQFVGRMIGDRLVDRFGQRAVARTGGLITAGGMGLALAFPTVPGAIAGFAAAGFGVATLVPAALHAADELPGFRPGTALTLVSWLMRLGFLLSPPIVGLVSDATSLRTGLLVVPAAGVLVILLAGVLSNRRHATPAD
ncbi:MFS transporter [Micromonosporaceae bacterium Da 78-11]